MAAVILAWDGASRHDADRPARACGQEAYAGSEGTPAADPTEGVAMLKGFKNFIMRGNIVEVAVALVVALAFSGLITQFVGYIINPLLAATVSGKKIGLGWLLRRGNPNTFVNVGGLIGALIYFVIFMAVIYFAIVVPYKAVQRRRGLEAFGDPPPVKTCPFCLSADLPVAASKCKYCGTDQPTATASAPAV
jgi:large conductance mechanosensitive channel